MKIQKRHNRSLYTREFFDKPYDDEDSFGPTYGLHCEALEFGAAQYDEPRDLVGLKARHVVDRYGYAY